MRFAAQLRTTSLSLGCNPQGERAILGLEIIVMGFVFFYLAVEIRLMYKVGPLKRLLGSMHTIPHMINLLLFIAVYSIRLAAYVELQRVHTREYEGRRVVG